jgi:hypothetical protein
VAAFFPAVLLLGCDRDPTKPTHGTTPVHDHTGDDDDDDGPTASTGLPWTTEPGWPQLTMWAQFSVVEGQIVPSSTKGANTYTSMLVVNLGPPEWDPNDQDDQNYCTVTAPLGLASLGLLDPALVVPPSGDLGPTPVAETDCYEQYTLPVGSDPTTLLRDYSGWSVGVASALTPELQARLDQIDPQYQDLFLGAHWSIPIIDPPQWESIYGVGNAVVDGQVVAESLARSQVHGQVVLPDGIYYTDPLLIIGYWF